MSANATTRPPFPHSPPYPDRDSEPYWRALSEGRFELQGCDACGALRWPPRAICNRCRSFEESWREVDRGGRVVSWTRTHQVFAPNCRDAVPYYVVQVALDIQPDILMIGGWLGDAEPNSGESVRLELVEIEEGHKLPCWTPSPTP